MIGDIQRGGIQTSFIPKKPLTSYGGGEKTGIMGIINFIAIIIFVIALSVYGGGYAYKTFLKGQIASVSEQIEKVKKDLENKDTLMKEMIRFDTKLITARELLDKHISLRRVFEVLEQDTMQNLRYNDFNYTNKNNEKIELKMSGEASGYSTIAWQAQKFYESKKTGDRDFTDVVFSGLNPGVTGSVVFQMVATVRPDLILYSNLDNILGGY